MAEPIPRGWMPYALAAKQYIGIAPSVLLGAIKCGELRAYEKPRTRATQAKIERHQYYVNLDDVDTYIRTYWQEVN